MEPRARHLEEGYSEARVLAEVSLLPDKIRIASGRRAVAMATGFIDRTYNKREPRKQVLVVVTSGWFVMCFDHNLKKLWEANLQVHHDVSCIANFCISFHKLPGQCSSIHVLPAPPPLHNMLRKATTSVIVILLSLCGQNLLVFSPRQFSVYRIYYPLFYTL